MSQNSLPSPPVARKIRTETTLHGTTLTDDYAWLRDKENPEVTAYLEAENAYADAAMAPLVFPGTVHVEWLHRTATEERLRIWAASADGGRCWTSRRRLDPGGLTVTFQQDTPQPPIAYMRGQWSVREAAGSRCVVTLKHDYRAARDDPADLDWIGNLVDQVSSGQLAALARFMEFSGPVPAEADFEVGCPVAEACELAADPGLWGGRPEVAHLLSDLRVVSYSRAAGGGGPGQGQVALVSAAATSIRFKELRPAPPVTAHTGSWCFAPADGTRTMVSVRERFMLAAGTPVAEVSPPVLSLASFR